MSRIAGFTGHQSLEMTNILSDGLIRGMGVSTNKLHSFGEDNINFVIQGKAQSFYTQNLWVVLDGLIYNSDEFEITQNDAELIGILYLRFGFIGALERLNGDFGIALYDGKTDSLYLGRDRLGVRPLYWTLLDNHLAFASRPLPLAKIHGKSITLNKGFVARFAVCHYRYFDNIPDESPYKEVFQLPSASWLKWDNGKISSGIYWQLEDKPDLEGTIEDLASRYKFLLLDSVNRRLQKVCKPAFTLSGGMDSSSVLACASHNTGQRFDAFSSVYHDKTYDESQDIQVMLSGPVQTWNPIQVDNPDIFQLVQRMVTAHDEPVATATWLSHFIVCEAISKGGYDAVFGGLGGDELNAGEYEYFFFHFADLQAQGYDDNLTTEIKAWAHYHDHPIFRKNSEIAFATLSRVVDTKSPGRCLVDQQRFNRYSNALNPDYFDIASFLPIMEHRFSSYLKNRTWQDLSRETAPCCLRAEDRQTNAFGLYNIAPFFDDRLVEFMFRISGNLKIKNGVTKVLLREAMKTILPEETRTRVKKTGWNAPAHLWFSGQGRELLLDRVHSHHFQAKSVFRMEEVFHLISEHEQIVQSGANQENHMMFLWQLLNLDVWMEEIQT